MLMPFGWLLLPPASAKWRSKPASCRRPASLRTSLLWLLTSLLLERARGLRVESGNGEEPKERISLQELAASLPPRAQRRAQRAEQRGRGLVESGGGSDAKVVWWRPAKGSDAAVVG